MLEPLDTFLTEQCNSFPLKIKSQNSINQLNSQLHGNRKDLYSSSSINDYDVIHEIEAKALIYKANFLTATFYLQNIIYLRVEEYHNKSYICTETTEQIDSLHKRLQIEIQDPLKVCLETDILINSLLKISQNYKLHHTEKNEITSSRSDYVYILCQKQVSGLWEVDMMGNLELLKQLTLNIFKIQLNENSYLNFSGSKLSCLKLSSINQTLIKYVGSGSELVIQISDISDISDFNEKFCNIKKYNKCLSESNHHTSMTSIDQIKKSHGKTKVIRQADKASNTEVSHLLTLQQREISCIIGIKGQRLNSIRDITGCTIKVLSVEMGNSISLSLPRKNIPQSILITGSRSSINHAIRIIDQYITLYRESDTKFI